MVSRLDLRRWAYLLGVLGALACAGPRGPGTARVRPPAAPTVVDVELVETVPVETALGHPGLRDAAEVWLEMIAGARASIDLGQFYASNAPGSRLEPVVAALEAALARGVRVRMLAEQKFVQVYPDTLARLARAGAVVRHFDLSATTHGILHAKYFVVDDREGFLGSQNFDWRALEHNYELGVRVRAPDVVAGLAAIFAADWARSGGAPVPELPPPPRAAAPRPAASPAVTLVASPPTLLPAGVGWDLPRLVQLIDGAHRTIRIQLLTYRAQDDAGPWDELEAPLVRAAERGVQVELMLADWSKRPRTLVGLQRLARTPNLAIRLVTIPPWSGGFIPFARVTHAKLLVVDGAHGWVGTSNWEKDYFYASRNLGLLLEAPALAAQLEAFFATEWQSAYAVPLDPDATYAAPRIE